MAEHTLAQHAPAPAPEVRLDDVLALAGGEGGAWAHRVLGVPLGADDAAIRKAFYRLSLAMHPDHNPRDRERATAAQETLNLAYRTLTGDSDGARVAGINGSRKLVRKVLIETLLSMATNQDEGCTEKHALQVC